MWSFFFFGICIAAAASASSYCRSFLFECQHYYYSRWCNSRCLSACLFCLICLSSSLRFSLSLSLLFFQRFLFNSYHYVSNEIHLDSIWLPTLFYPLQASLFLLAWHSTTLSPLTLAVMGEKEKAPCCCLASLFLLFIAKALTVLPLSGLGKMEAFTFHTEMWQRTVLLVNTVHYCLDSWWPRLNPPAPASVKTAQKRDFLTWKTFSVIKAEALLFYFCILCSSVSLSLLSTV